MLLKNDVAIMIPAYNPDEKMISFLSDLRKAGYDKIIIIDDGSKKECYTYFETAKNQYGCRIVSHSINLGQGRAYKTGFNYYLSPDNGFEGTIGIIQCDCDGQHHIDDINKCAELMRLHSNSFIVGVRDFGDRTIPFRSRFGNNLTSFVFKFFCGINLKDTQTGLKGIPSVLIPKLMEVPGERFEYASSILLDIHRSGTDIVQFPIQTIYINGNETSHFNPLIDSLRIYGLILKYLMSSLSAFVVDICFFCIFLSITKDVFPNMYIVISSYAAKIISCSYSYTINRKYVFENSNRPLNTVIKYFALCVIQSTFSAIGTKFLVDFLTWKEPLCKILVDTVLFFVSFQVQNVWVFRKTK